MKNFFLEQKTFACSLQDKTLINIFEQWKNNDYQVKKCINSNHVLIRRKYASKAYGDVLINISFNVQKQLLSAKITPVPIAYILFAIVPLSYVILLTGKINYLYFLAPIVFLSLLIFTFKWNLLSNKKKVLIELRYLFRTKGIKCDFDK